MVTPEEVKSSQSSEFYMLCIEVLSRFAYKENSTPGSGGEMCCVRLVFYRSPAFKNTKANLPGLTGILKDADKPAE